MSTAEEALGLIEAQVRHKGRRFTLRLVDDRKPDGLLMATLWVTAAGEKYQHYEGEGLSPEEAMRAVLDAAT